MYNGTVAVHPLAVVQIADAIAGGAVAPPRRLKVFSHPGQMENPVIHLHPFINILGTEGRIIIKIIFKKLKIRGSITL